jgi:hypothetical protein
MQMGDRQDVVDDKIDFDSGIASGPQLRGIADRAAAIEIDADKNISRRDIGGIVIQREVGNAGRLSRC